MRHRSAKLGLALVIVVTALVGVGCWYRGYLAAILPSAAAEMGDISLPPGFQISVYAPDVPNARQMALGPPGVVFVGSRSEGKVYAVVDRNGDHRADEVHVLASGLDRQSGLACRDGTLYVPAGNRILRFSDVAPAH
jgi:glucose/arabinose dehydrogenase